MKKRNNIYLILACCCCLVLVGGCKKKETPPVPVPIPVPKNKPVKTQPAPVLGKMSSAQQGVPREPSLSVLSPKDPFKPYIIEQKAARPLHRASANALPIQQYDVQQFKVTGIIVGLKVNRAQIIDPLGKAYVVREGMLIGSNEGKIVKISASGIEVLELYREGKGKIVRKIIKLTLPKKG